ncbi:MAG: transcription antitermination factor NusB [Nitriliruptoraceae bacterium]|nr:transcription antitermination factor NusB [Nitriliruptoraceae bacterium]
MPTPEQPADATLTRGPRRTDTDSPHRARARALKILFQADVRGVSPEVTLRRLQDEPAARQIIDAVDDLSSGSALLPPDIDGALEVELVSSERSEVAATGDAHGGGEDGSPLDGFTRSLVAGVHADRERIDGLIARFARNWQISRMPAVDRTVLRLAVYELIHEDTSAAIVIDEAVGLAKSLSTDDSGRYVNGVLESIRRELAANPLPREVDRGLAGGGPASSDEPRPPLDTPARVAGRKTEL